MQLTGETRRRAAELLGVTEAALCDNSDPGARLNILGGAAVLRDYACWASPRVTNQNDFYACSNGQSPYALTDIEKQKLAETLEAWWWPISRYNGGGLDTYITTSNYPFRVWNRLRDLNISYPPLSSVRYLLNGERAPDGKIVWYSPNEIQSNDDNLYPTPNDLGRPGLRGGIRWVRGSFDPFREVTLHRNDGSVFLPSSELIRNGGFEQGMGNWLIPNWGNSPTPFVSSSNSHAGQFSVRLGTIDGSSEPRGYSAIYQWITIPPNAGSVTLSFWYWPSTTDFSTAYDGQQVLVYDSNGNQIATLMQVLENDRQWKQKTFNLSQYRGQRIALLFNVYQDGAGDPTGMYVDDVSVTYTTGGQSANLQITLAPNPVPQDPSRTCLSTRPAWFYTATLNETSGVGIRITTFTWDFYDSSGNFLNTQLNTGGDFANFFDDCGTGSTYIAPYGRACGSLCTHLGGRNSGSVVLTFYGTDDNGNNLSFRSDRLVLLGSGNKTFTERSYTTPQTAACKSR